VSNVKLDPLADEAGAYPGLKSRSGTLASMKAVGGRALTATSRSGLKPVSGAAGEEIARSQSGAEDRRRETDSENERRWLGFPCSTARTSQGGKTHPVAPGDWRVEDGILIGRGPKVSHLYTEHGDYEDLHFRVGGQRSTTAATAASSSASSSAPKSA